MGGRISLHLCSAPGQNEGFSAVLSALRFSHTLLPPSHSVRVHCFSSFHAHSFREEMAFLMFSRHRTPGLSQVIFELRGPRTDAPPRWPTHANWQQARPAIRARGLCPARARQHKGLLLISFPPRALSRYRSFGVSGAVLAFAHLKPGVRLGFPGWQRTPVQRRSMHSVAMEAPTRSPWSDQKSPPTRGCELLRLLLDLSCRRVSPSASTFFLVCLIASSL